MPTGKMKTKLNGGLESPILANVKTKKENAQLLLSSRIRCYSFGLNNNAQCFRFYSKKSIERRRWLRWRGYGDDDDDEGEMDVYKMVQIIQNDPRSASKNGSFACTFIQI